MWPFVYKIVFFYVINFNFVDVNHALLINVLCQYHLLHYEAFAIFCENRGNIYTLQWSSIFMEHYWGLLVMFSMEDFNWPIISHIIPILRNGGVTPINLIQYWSTLTWHYPIHTTMDGLMWTHRNHKVTFFFYPASSNMIFFR